METATFADTSALYALMDRDDNNHAAARGQWEHLVVSGTPIVSSNYVIVETCALVQHRLGFEAVRALQEDLLPLLEVHFLQERHHLAATAALLAAGRRKLSLVDCSSFVLMRELGLRVAFAFDGHFQEQGFSAVR